MKLYAVLFRAGNFRAKKKIRKKFGRAYQKQLYAPAAEWFSKIAKGTPGIGRSVFAFNYAFAPAYIAWYKSSKELNACEADTQWLLWLMNEKIITMIPRLIRKAYGERYLTDFRKKAPQHEERGLNGLLHPYDFTIHFHPDSDTHFGIDITRCGMRTLAADFDAMGIFPTVCRVDYMIGAYLNSRFERTKTLGNGDSCCNCSYTIGVKCEWHNNMSFKIK